MQLPERFAGRLKENEPLSKHVNIRMGGAARFYFDAKSKEEVVEAVNAAKGEGLAWGILGGGSNTLPSDRGFDGLVIRTAMLGWKIEGDRATAEAGVPSAFLARKTAEAGLSGFEWAISLPGTVGGAVRGNAGCFGGEIRDTLIKAEVLRGDGTIVMLRNEECRFGYRDSVFKKNSDIVLAATFTLAPAPKEECLARLEAALAKRKVEQPLDQSSAGCMFKNFDYENDAQVAMLRERTDVPEAFLKAKRIPAGWLIDRADLKGLRIGDAIVSGRHANFLVNAGHATASDVVQLISLIKMKVRDLYGIQLEEEVQLMGF